MKSESFNLGRVLGKLEYLLEDEAFNQYSGRPKDFLGWWEKQDKEKQEEYLHANIYHLEHIYDALCECVGIARGHDDLNQSKE